MSDRMPIVNLILTFIEMRFWPLGDCLLPGSNREKQTSRNRIIVQKAASLLDAVCKGGRWLGGTANGQSILRAPTSCKALLRCLRHEAATNAVQLNGSTLPSSP